MTPSATLPSSSTLTLVSAIEGPTTLARAFSAKRPNPPVPGGAPPDPAQGVAQRRAVDGQRAFHHHAGAVGDACRRTPASAARWKAAPSGRNGRPTTRRGSRWREIAPSTRSPRQSNCPVAANEREIDGHASERSISSSFSDDVIGGVLVTEHAVLDPDFGERHRVVGAGLHGAGDGVDERRPVALAIGRRAPRGYADAAS